jgi:hypothetical protein
MKCENSLVLLLEAEREELEGRGTSEVAAHVRECARCGAVAARLLADTQVLATHIATHVAARGVEARAARRSVSRPLVFGGALVAAAAIAMLLMPAREIRVDVPAAVRTAARVSPEPATRSAPSTPLTPLKPLARIHETRFADAVAATPVRLVTSQTSERHMPASEFDGVSVAPPSGIRSTVLATRNPKITVVWLY